MLFRSKGAINGSNLINKDRAMNFSEYHENKFYDCVSIKLHREIVTDKLKHENYSSNLILSSQTQIDEPKNKEIDLQLTIRFNEVMVKCFLT